MTIYFVPLPEDASEHGGIYRNKLCMFLNDGSDIWIGLPPGDWKLVGISDEMTEEQITDLLGNHEYGKNSFTNEVKPTGFVTDDTKYTLLSLLRSHNITGRAAVMVQNNKNQ